MRRGGLQGYIIRRLIYAVLIAFGVVTCTFILLRLGPSSPADKYLANMSARSQNPSQVVAAIEARYGLDKPIYEQYVELAGQPGPRRLGLVVQHLHAGNAADSKALDIFLPAYPSQHAFFRQPGYPDWHLLGDKAVHQD